MEDDQTRSEAMTEIETFERVLAQTSAEARRFAEELNLMAREAGETLVGQIVLGKKESYWKADGRINRDNLSSSEQ